MTTEIVNFTTEAAWLKARQQDVTSTESAALFGMSPYTTHFELWHRKHSNTAPEFKSNERMKWGNRLEAAIARDFDTSAVLADLGEAVAEAQATIMAVLRRS